jgi:hypothetical protein
VSFTASVSGHVPGAPDAVTTKLMAAFETLATTIKDEGGSGTVTLDTLDGTGVHTLNFKPGDDIAWC